MKSYRIPALAVFTSGLLVLSACGGGGNHNTPDTPSFLSRLNASMSALGAASSIASSGVADLFEEKYLDMGSRKADVVAALSATSQAAAANPDLSLFPMAQVTNATLTACDSDVCTLNATLSNSDVDTTAVDFSTQVKVINGVVYLFGDQSATATI